MSQTLTGTVVSNKMQKTVVIRIDRRFRHPVYKKVITRSKRIKAHYDGKTPVEGTVVTIRQSRPISKDVNYIVVEA